MSDIPQHAIDAAAQALDDGILPGALRFDEGVSRRIACRILEAAEQAWPHEPPQHDPASTISCTTERAWAPTTQAHGHAFGFSRDGTL